jgi:hypothetical protein
MIFATRAMKNPVILTVTALCAVLLVIALAYVVRAPESGAINTCDTGWSIGSTRTINCHGICRVVGKSGGTDFFVPTRANFEWGEFLNNPPPNASFSSCGGGGGGAPVCSSVVLCSQYYDEHRKSIPICSAGCLNNFNTACQIICTGSAAPGRYCRHRHNVYCDSVTRTHCYTTFSNKTEVTLPPTYCVS